MDKSVFFTLLCNLFIFYITLYKLLHYNLNSYSSSIKKHKNNKLKKY